MRKSPHNLRAAYLLLAFLIVTVTACSPKVQQTGLRAPANIKIDGQTLEWPNNKLQAYNPDTRLEYTLCNDDDDLYLTIRTSGHNAIDKIMYSGLVFTLNYVTNGGKEDTNKVAATFPVITAKQGFDIVGKAMHYDNERHRNDSTARLKRPQLDSLLVIINKTATETFNELKVTGIKELKDSLISASNTKGINAVGQFNRKMEYTYELAIPLKLLGLAVKGANKFSYHIRLHGVRLSINRDANGVKTYEVYETKKARPGPDMNPDIKYMRTPTELFGEYTLAKKE